MLLDKLPRIPLAILPTPLQEATRLSAELGGPRILIKRDDMTGLALGGNKTRKLEFVMAEAKEKGADIVITTGGSQSNHACQTAAAANRLGMETILVLFRGVHFENQGNLLLDGLYGAKVELVGTGLADRPLVQRRIEELTAELRSKGRHPYVVPGGAFTPLGTAGYVNAVDEICQQLKEQGQTAQYLFVCAGGGNTMSGLVVGARYFQAPFRVIGISISAKPEVLPGRIADEANATAQLLEMDLTFTPEDMNIYYDYIGEGYGIPTAQGMEAIKLLARTEGLVLDPVYTGKTMSGLIDLIRQGKFSSEDTVIFLHTGGAPSVFAYDRELTQAMS